MKSKKEFRIKQMEVLPLLRSKNRCLERFLKLSEDFVSQIEQFGFTGLDEFHQKRDKIIQALEMYDRKISQVVQMLRDDKKTEQLKKTIERNLARKDELIRQIVKVDQTIIVRVEAERTRVQEEILESRKSSEQLSKFKSSWIPQSGEGLDKKL